MELVELQYFLPLVSLCAIGFPEAHYRHAQVLYLWQESQESHET